MRQPLVAGNWKMHGSRESINALLRKIMADYDAACGVELAVFPPYTYLQQVQELLSNTPIRWGAQNVSSETSGAFTGEISAEMLQDFGCHYVLVGHSERRRLFGEDNLLVAMKFIRAAKTGLFPILCVGETLEEREAGNTEQVIQQQLLALLDISDGREQLRRGVIAYEPVWAIGTGITATPDQAQQVHAFIRKIIAKNDENVAQQLRILYGGSIKASNAEAIFAMPDIDGGLVGGASLDAKEFIEITNLCKR